jgi:tRNA (guanine-N7-)-methyltransferase
MAKKKLIRFKENTGFSCLFEPNALELLKEDFKYKGKWCHEYFGNQNPLVLELGCGKGEYTTGLSQLYKDKNFIGVDIKGSRLFFGARTVETAKIANAAFVRSQIELIDRIFSREASEIWVTFPDPLPDRRHQRLTAPRFLNLYRELLKPDGTVCLKTDDYDLFAFTAGIARDNGLTITAETNDLYNSELLASTPAIQTTYEKKFLEAGKKICLLRFKLDNPIKPLKKKDNILADRI